MPAVELFDAVVAVHVMSVVLAFGWGFAYPLVFRWLRAQQPAALAPMHAVQERLANFLITPAAALAGLSGLYLAIDGDLFDRIWVQVPIVIYFVTGFVALWAAPKERQAAELAADPVSPEYRALYARLQRAAGANCLLILVAIFFMVAKPGGY